MRGGRALNYVVSSRPIVIHSLAHARAALAAAASLSVPVTLHSAPGAGAQAGPAWFERVIAAARAEFPHVAVTAILDCDDAPGAVMAALRWLKEPGRTAVMLSFSGEASAAARLRDMAAVIGVELICGTPPGLDLRTEPDALAACRVWLAETTAERVAPR